MPHQRRKPFWYLGRGRTSDTPIKSLVCGTAARAGVTGHRDWAEASHVGRYFHPCGFHPRLQLVKAFVVLRSGYDPTTELVEELQRHVKTRLAAHAFPREIEFLEQLPKTPSGKIQRFLLREREIAKAQDAKH